MKSFIVSALEEKFESGAKILISRIVLTGYYLMKLNADQG
jgi:hypothetical protein